MTAHGKQRQTAAEIVVTGSMAYDFILSYPGDFRDHLIADKMHVLSISLLVPTMKQQRGGTAGNMAYSLALLGQTCSVLATVGAEDFNPRASCAWRTRYRCRRRVRSRARCP